MTVFEDLNKKLVVFFLCFGNLFHVLKPQSIHICEALPAISPGDICLRGRKIDYVTTVIISCLVALIWEIPKPQSYQSFLSC